MYPREEDRQNKKHADAYQDAVHASPPSTCPARPVWSPGELEPLKPQARNGRSTDHITSTVKETGLGCAIRNRMQEWTVPDLIRLLETHPGRT
jgi:hypothetical protein